MLDCNASVEEKRKALLDAVNAHKEYVAMACILQFYFSKDIYDMNLKSSNTENSIIQIKRHVEKEIPKYG